MTGICRVVTSSIPPSLRLYARGDREDLVLWLPTSRARPSLYSASKGAVQALTFAMAADHLDEGIRVNCVTPGTAETPWVKRLLEPATIPGQEREPLERRQPMGRLVSADEVANAITYLASPLSASATGTSLAVNGGMQTLHIVAPRPTKE